MHTCPTKIENTGSIVFRNTRILTNFIDLVVKGVTVRTVHNNNPDSSYVTTSQGVELDIGQTIQFVRSQQVGAGNGKFTAKCYYKLTYELFNSLRATSLESKIWKVKIKPYYNENNL